MTSFRSLAFRFRATWVLGALGVATAAACSAGGPGSDYYGSGGSTHTGTTGATAGQGTGGSDLGFTSGDGEQTGGGNGSGVGGSGSTCAADPYTAKQLDLDMYIMLDQSQSMDESAGSTTKWAAVTAALNGFVGQKGIDGISVGIQYFGLGGSATNQCPTSCNSSSDCGTGCGTCHQHKCNGAGGGGNNNQSDSCTASDYETPEVEIAALPGVAGAITASLAKHGPSTSTPTSAALQGAVNHATSWAKAHTDHIVIAVLATDGQPTECDTSQSGLTSIAKAGVSGTPAVKTFTIGVFGSTDIPSGPNLMSQIAAAGGTGQSFTIDTSSGNVEQQFLAALNTIRGSALGCQYTIPVPKTGTADFNALNVRYTPGSGGGAQSFANYADAAHCPASGDGWYYDNDSAPTQILLCANTCSKVEADTKGSIEVLLGCKTVVGQPG